MTIMMGHKTLLGNITKMIGKENMGIRFMKALKELLRVFAPDSNTWTKSNKY